MHNYYSTSTFLLLFLASTFLPSTMSIKAGYWPSYRNSTFPATSIHFPYFTHVYYAFVQPDPTSFALVITDFDAEAIPGFVAAAHADQYAVKAMLTVDGGASSLTTFGRLAALASSEVNRAAFIKSTIEVARKFGLDGLDLDWEYPADVGQMADLGSLALEWRKAVDNEAVETKRPRLLLSAAVYYASTVPLGGVTRSYPASTMAFNLDFINAMCYDYHGGWDTTATGAPAALYDPTSNISTSHGIESWISAGVPAHKLSMGIPLYSHTWQLKNASDNGIGAPAVAVGPGDKGILLYSDTVEFNRNNSATVVYSGTTVSTYSYTGTSWVGYDDPKSVVMKIQYAKGRGLGGYFFWALGYDDKYWSVSRSASTTWNA